jgi:hypothetical protein
MPGDHELLAADLAIAARATAAELRFEDRPRTRTGHSGTPGREDRHTTVRRNVESPVEPGRTYRDVSAETRISTRLP